MHNTPNRFHDAKYATLRMHVVLLKTNTGLLLLRHVAILYIEHPKSGVCWNGRGKNV